MMLYLKLYLLFLKIGLLGFGGGYMMIPLFFLEIVGCPSPVDFGPVFLEFQPHDIR
jgi:hypothetical protein